MPTFKYLAKRGPQDVIEGVLEAENRATALSQLTGLGYIPVRIQEAAGKPDVAPAPPVVQRARGVPIRHFNQFTRQFASLVRSQVPLLRALSILKEQTSHLRLQQVLVGIGEDVRQGQTLSESLAKYPAVFSPMYISLTRAGEIAGTLDTILDRLAVQADREEALRAKVQAAFVYPAFVGVVGMGTVIFLLTFVMPRLVKLFQGFRGRLPLPTRMLLRVTALMQSWWFWAACVLLVIGVVVFVRRYGERYRLKIDQCLLRLPIFGPLIRDLELARFSRAFGLMLDHGIPILQAVDVTIPTVENRIIRQELSRLPASLKEGGSVTACLKGTTVATPFVINTLAVGEEVGKVSEALTEIANVYEREVERLLQVMASLLEPVMILVVGAIVGFIVLAVLLPIFELSVIAR